MPSLFTLPGPRNGPNNFLSEYLLPYGSTYTVAADTTYYAALPVMFSADHNWPTFINHGTLWDVGLEGAGVLAGFYIPYITNTGTMIADATDGNAWGIFVGSGGYTVDNSGSIYAIANGQAFGIFHAAPDVVVRNIGLIAAYAPSAGSSGVGGALGIDMYNGGTIINGAGGSILAEGVAATAIIYNGSLLDDTVLRNDGRIEALSTTPGQPSYGIVAGGVHELVIVNLVNNGLLKADIAWSSYGDHPYYAPRGSDHIVNEAAGHIIGRIETGRGHDRILNQGAITGNVDLGDDDDWFDTSAGSLTGAVDLGWHEDEFFGSAGANVVKGNRGNDRLYGNGGNDLLLGGIGHDRLEGGTGNDGLYGELGEDEFVTLGADRASGGDGDDLLYARDLAFALITGDAGYDTLRLDVGAIKLDLAAAIATGRLQSIERIDLEDGQQLAVRSGDAAALAGNRLDVGGASGSQLTLVGAWSEGVPADRDGTSWRSFSLGSEKVFVAPDVAVSVSAAMPTGFSGLAAVAGGAAAPLAGSVPGSELSNPVLNISWYYLPRTTVIDSGETWQSIGAPVIQGFSVDAALINHGLMTATNGEGVYYTIGNDVPFILNTGTIRGFGSGDAPMAAINVRGRLENHKLIEVVTEGGEAMAAAIGSTNDGLVLANHGTISARSATAAAIAVQISQSSPFEAGAIAVNTGRIEAQGGSGTIGLKLFGGGLFVNEGTIAASGAPDALAVQLWNDNPNALYNRLDNRGSIIGANAIRSDAGDDDLINSGNISGAVQLGDGNDLIDNKGAITGSVDLGAGTDLYLGTGATTAAIVAGGAGVDLIVGSNSADRLEGGEGNDVLVGGGAADTLFGGGGADRFMILSATDSTAAAADTVEDFETGVDRIDLGALAPTAVSLSSAGGFTTVTAETAGGTVSIRVAGTVALADIDIAAKGQAVNGTSAGEVLVATVAGTEVRAGAGDDLLLGTPGNDILSGEAGADVNRGAAGNDVYLVDNLGDRVIERFGEGIDEVRAYAEFTLPSDVENLTMAAGGIGGYGNALDNLIRGNPADNYLYGGAGDDIIIGGAGPDHMTGGLDADVFVYQAVGDSTASAYDRIWVFESGIDKIDLTALTVTSISWVETYDLFNGTFQVVTIETADGPMTIWVHLQPVFSPPLAMSDFILPMTGTPGEDNLTGTADADTLFGLEGDDFLNGGSGADSLTGGAGDDVLIGGPGSDKLAGSSESDRFVYLVSADSTAAAQDRISDFESGIDTIDLRAITMTYIDWTVQSNGTGTFNIVTIGTTTGTMSIRVDGTLARSDFLDPGRQIIGTEGSDDLAGGLGNDLLDGRGGADVLRGAAGDDVYRIDDGLDTVVELTGEGNDRVVVASTYVLTAGAHVETLKTSNVAGTHAIDLTGNEFDNDISGNAGANVLDGGSGGIDTLRGFGGNDLYFVDAGDIVIEAVGAGQDTAEARTSYTLSVGAQVELLQTTDQAGIAAINLTGNELDNRIVGNAGVNILDGGNGGLDRLKGYGGNDEYHVETDDLILESAGEGYDVARARSSFVLNVGAEVEVLKAASPAATTALNLTGNEFDNILVGSAGANRLDGGAGGLDVLRGLNGDDIYFVSAGDQVLELAGGGQDTVKARTSFVLNDGAQVEILQTANAGGTEAINLSGNEFDNRIIGNSGRNILYGGSGGIDQLGGLGGDDVYLVSTGDIVVEKVGGGHDVVKARSSYVLGAGVEVELLQTAKHADTAAINLTGNELDNRIIGNGGENVLKGWLGSDTLLGNGGADRFIFNAALGPDNVDEILDFTVGVDEMGLDDAIFAAVGPTLNPREFVIGGAAGDADDRIIYDSATGALFYDADGNGAGAAIQFATIDAGLTLTVGDFVVI